MWEAEVVCGECNETHRVHSSLPGIPRGFAFECPRTGGRLSIAFRNPTLMAQPWAEVGARSAAAIDALAEEQHGSLE